MDTKKVKQRKSHFEKWWSKNYCRVAAHHWMVKNLNRVIHNYNNPPEVFYHSKNIIKRYNNSEYKRLHKEDARFAWRILHPNMNKRRERLLSTALYLQEQIEKSGRKMSNK